MRDGMRALFRCGGVLRTSNTRSLDLALPRERGADGARDDRFLMMLGNLLRRDFFGAALLAEFLEEFFLAERIGAVQQTEQ